MALRTGAGTGVIVSLVVFVLTTIFLLVLTIVFYAGQQKEKEIGAQAVADLEKYVQSRERNRDDFKRYEAEAGARSVTRYLHDRQEATVRLVSGSPSKTVDELKSDFTQFGVQEGGSVLATMSRMNRDLRSRQAELDAANRRLQEMEQEIQQKDTDIEQLNRQHEQEIAGIQGEIDAYRMAAESHAEDVTNTIEQLQTSEARLKDRYQSRIDSLEQQNDEQGQQVVLLTERLNDFERIISERRVKGQSPELLVDGQVIDNTGSNDQVFINRGKSNRIVLGMTFEVYDDAGSIRVNDRTGEIPRGKASLQVIKVDETTSTCKITRSIPGRPVVRNDVIANAVYDPEYKFKFLVHGKFDVDNDGKPSEAEAEYVRSLIVNWGGTVIYAEELPGDLDFLVLGEVPPMPPPLRDNATEQEINIYLQRRKAKEDYDMLFKQASEAQIPVLNANRFFILIGHTER